MKAILLVYGAAVLYAVIRYGWFTPDNLRHLPAFLTNKGLSMAAALCFGLAFWQQWRRQRGGTGGLEPATWFRAGMAGAIAHIPLSLVILRPAYFAEFFTGDRLSFMGEAVFLFGGLSAAGIFLASRATWSARQRWTVSLATLCLLFGHVLCMGWARGLNLHRQHAYLPPMWLLSLLGIVAGLAFLLRTRPGPDAPPKTPPPA